MKKLPNAAATILITLCLQIPSIEIES